MEPLPFSPLVSASKIKLRLGLTVVAAILAPVAWGQTTSAAATNTGPASNGDEVIALDPFVTNSAGDRGYQAQSSLGGSRLATPLKDIASPTTAFTSQFLQDTAITNSDDLAKYMLSTEYDLGEDSGGQNRLNPSNRPLRVRGLPGGTYSINFFRNDLRFDTFDLDRIDQSRGPNSVLFGIGSPGGIINVTTKRAILSHEQGSASVQGQRYGGLREEGDYNQPILNDRLAIRVAAVKTQTGSWRNYEYDDQKRYFGTLKWKIDSKTELNLEVEKGDIDKETKRTIVGYDAYTNWVAAGSQLGTVANAAQAIARIAGANIPYIVYDSQAGTIANYVNKTQSALRTSVDGENLPITNFSIVPKQTSFYGPGYNQTTSYDRSSAFLTHAFSRDFYTEFAVIRTDKHSEVFDPQGAQYQALKVDTNATLPNGLPNPNAGATYIEANNLRNDQDSRDDAARLIFSYTHDFGFWGKHTIAGVLEYDFSNLNQIITREEIISPNAPTVTGSADNVNNRVFRRTYVSLKSPSTSIVLRDFQKQPINSIAESLSGNAYTTGYVPFNANSQINSDHATSSIGMIQSSFWHDRINTVVGGSYDERTDYLGKQAFGAFPGFANGIIQDLRGHAPTFNHAKSYSLSGVFHVTDWLGLTYAKSQNSALPSFTGRVHSPDGTSTYARPPTPRGQSEDAGLKLDVWKHKIFLTADYFETVDKRDFDFTPLLTSTINPIWVALQAAGVPAPAGYTYDQTLTSTGLPSIADLATGSTYDAKTHGVEFEATANITENWRTFFNFSHEINTHSNVGPEYRAYVALWRPFWLANSAVPLSGVTGTVGSQVTAVDNAVQANYVIVDGREPYGQQKDKFNLRTTYDFTRNWAKGISVGGGARFNSAPVIGYFPSLDSSGKTTARVVRGSEQVFFDVNASYRRHLKVFNHSTQWSVQVNIDNVTNNQAFVKLRVATDGNVELYKFNPPLQWIVSTKLSF